MVQDTTRNVDLQMNFKSSGDVKTTKTFDCLNKNGNYTDSSDDSKKVRGLADALNEFSSGSLSGFSAIGKLTDFPF